ncbi:MAG: short-chain dehydrogenase [Cyanobacteria bacterium NC_groundwater_1444_Ag_S-0.65um_54_12]|nr:short-chain dehydrogenase [Cyanobacteria bacterium NC_groundwater_1444_Ag_S-0.65um_54_12]
MNIEGKRILILGGAGMVGMAVARELIRETPAQIILHSLREAEVREAIATLTDEQQLLMSQQGSLDTAGPPTMIPLGAEWGNIFVRLGLHDRDPQGLMADATARRLIIEDLIGEFGEQAVERFYLHDLLIRQRPDLVIDTINTATGIAYGDLYSATTEAYQALQKLVADNALDCLPALQAATERLIATQYIPQLVRHVQILYRGMKAAGTSFYVKVGTSGTGGMGLNIPYTHGEERPSRMLLSKSAIAGAHTLLLFLQARTPDSPITKEIKPAAAIAWKRYGYGEILKRGKPIMLEDAILNGEGGARILPSERAAPLKAVYVDTGENGLFSVDEFVAISTAGQMEFVTPEEIAENIIAEVKGANTGKDVIDALNIACMGPTYRAGFCRSYLLDKLRRLQSAEELKENRSLTMAFEVLGPPRLSKLLYEAYLLKLCYQTIDRAAEATPAEMAALLRSHILENTELRKKILSIGIPILLEEAGKLRLLRSRQVAVPKNTTINLSDSAAIDSWAQAGWVDLRQSSLERWSWRMKAILRELHLIPAGDTSSRYVRDHSFWGVVEGPATIDVGEVVGWIFNTEEQGERARD